MLAQQTIIPPAPAARKKRLLFTGGVTALALALTIWWTTRPAADATAPTADTFYICKSCDNHFGLSTRALNAFQAGHYGQPFPCPKCSSTELIHAIHCTKCGEYYPHVRGQDPPCPKCGHKPSDPT